MHLTQVYHVLGDLASDSEPWYVFQPVTFLFSHLVTIHVCRAWTSLSQGAYTEGLCLTALRESTKKSLQPKILPQSFSYPTEGFCISQGSNIRIKQSESGTERNS